MPAKLELSGLIDRDGAGETPAVGSIFRKVKAIPRGRARQDNGRYLEHFCGGPPICPVCLKPNRVAFTGYSGRFAKKHGFKCSFHCKKCLVGWDDTDQVTCFVCDEIFTAERASKDLAPFLGGGMFTGRCYHINTIQHPFCERCEKIIGNDRAHHRRTLRRMVGLRKAPQ